MALTRVLAAAQRIVVGLLCDRSSVVSREDEERMVVHAPATAAASTASAATAAPRLEQRNKLPNRRVSARDHRVVGSALRRHEGEAALVCFGQLVRRMHRVKRPDGKERRVGGRSVTSGSIVAGSIAASSRPRRHAREDVRGEKVLLVGASLRGMESSSARGPSTSCTAAVQSSGSGSEQRQLQSKESVAVWDPCDSHVPRGTATWHCHVALTVALLG